MIIAGIAICIFNYGLLVYHSLIAVAVSYILITFLNSTPLIATSFVFHMTYLLAGYYYTATTTYDITWTMPHCVLILRLIGLAFDVVDGQRPISELSTAQQKSMITRKPNLIEVASFSFFPASFLIGPQISYRRYESYINKEFDKYTGYIEASTKRGLTGAAYLAVNVIGSAYLSDSYILSSDFVNNNGILMRMLLLGIWARITLYKYISCWILTESVAMCFGNLFILFYYVFVLNLEFFILQASRLLVLMKMVKQTGLDVRTLSYWYLRTQNDSNTTLTALTYKQIIG